MWNRKEKAVVKLGSGGAAHRDKSVARQYIE